MRTCVFPLRTNAGFYRDRGTLRLQQRVKEAALLYDEVVLQDGLYIANVGPTGAVEMIGPANSRTMKNPRSMPQRGGNFALYIRGRTIIADETERHFTAEYKSISDDIVAASGRKKLPDWIRLRAFEAPPELKSHVRRLAAEDAKQPGFWRRRGSPRLRDQVLQNLNHDLALAAQLDAYLSPDGYFAPLLRRKPGLKPGRGHVALRVAVPNFSFLGWERILEARDMPGIVDFRSKLREWEEEVLHTANLDGAVARESLLRRITRDLLEGWRPPSAVHTAGRIAVDLILGQIPTVGGGASAALAIAEARQKRHTWGAVFLRLIED